MGGKVGVREREWAIWRVGVREGDMVSESMSGTCGEWEYEREVR